MFHSIMFIAVLGVRTMKYGLTKYVFFIFAFAGLLVLYVTGGNEQRGLEEDLLAGLICTLYIIAWAVIGKLDEIHNTLKDIKSSDVPSK